MNNYQTLAPTEGLGTSPDPFPCEWCGRPATEYKVSLTTPSIPGHAIVTEYHFHCDREVCQ